VCQVNTFRHIKYEKLNYLARDLIIRARTWIYTLYLW